MAPSLCCREVAVAYYQCWGVGEFLESWCVSAGISDGIRLKQRLLDANKLFLAQEVVEVKIVVV